MRPVPVVVDSMLRVDGNLLGHDLVNRICDELIVPNHEREEAQRMGRPGWAEMPSEYFCCALDGDTLVMSRGYALYLKQLLRVYNLQPWWKDRRKWTKGSELGHEEFSYWPHQPAAVAAMKKHQQGIYKSPTGSGKTVTVCGFIWETTPQMSLILVDRINLVDQWMKRISKHMGIPIEEIGNIGDGTWVEKRVTVATVQTLHARRKKLVEEDWHERWDCVVLDECHHVTAKTFMSLLQEFPARYRLGVSATPDKTGVFELAENTLGPIFYETTYQELRDLGMLVEPHVEVVPTNFKFTYWGDHEADKSGNCEIPGCKSNKPKHRHRNNYMQLKKALVKDQARNKKIVNKILNNIGTHQLVVSDQITQLDPIFFGLIDAGVDRDKLWMLTGKDSRKRRDEVISTIESSDECILLSTIAGEALDIPVLDRIHLPFPTRNARKTEQNIGRGGRSYIGKTEAIIFDYADWNVPLLVGQFRSRRWQCYEKMSLEVKYEGDMTDSTLAGASRKLTSLGRAK